MRDIKKDLEKFYPSKKVKNVEIEGKNQVIASIDRHKFTQDDLQTNRPFRVLHEWVANQDWRGKVHYYVNEDNADVLEFIIIVH